MFCLRQELQVEKVKFRRRSSKGIDTVPHAFLSFQSSGGDPLKVQALYLTHSSVFKVQEEIL
jgi:hypothetical protein